MAEGRSEQQSKMIGLLVSKAWSDESFKKRLLSDTMAVLKENGIAVPAGVTIKAVENTDTLYHFVIPSKPGDELSDEDLGKVAGGYCDIYTGCDCNASNEAPPQPPPCSALADFF
ncbi:MAG: NHLP leader peptide family natural product precursor [Acidobacteria bacterium]|nr:MAG: NHLP leader peptide family natural product precursor [Acidobacteriota bacterium]